MSAANNLDKAQTVQESETKDTVTETIAYARRTYQGNNPDVKTLQPENNGPVKRFLNNISHALMSNRYSGS
ncbi:hypothetical protein B5807_03614 [Epicoccum nigrum]|uniref:Uncharacterized protein n=1 Tax=Epicoccum nigrum TaxID=105696 RepID=A0A1Y2M711_EPING|nr:hypothetical protein B5807_03614 [Epicoccum nigrum]